MSDSALTFGGPTAAPSVAPIVFLDIDGVLNCDVTKERFDGFIGIDQRLLVLFTAWWRARGYEIVLSSTWRRDEPFRAELKRCGLAWIGMTPIRNEPIGSGLIIRSACRGDEIAAWIQETGSTAPFVILDDMPDGNFLPEQRSRLIQTHGSYGLRPEDLRRADQLLATDGAPLDQAKVREP